MPTFPVPGEPWRMIPSAACLCPVWDRRFSSTPQKQFAGVHLLHVSVSSIIHRSCSSAVVPLMTRRFGSSDFSVSSAASSSLFCLLSSHMKLNCFSRVAVFTWSCFPAPTISTSVKSLFQSDVTPFSLPTTRLDEEVTSLPAACAPSLSWLRHLRPLYSAAAELLRWHGNRSAGPCQQIQVQFHFHFVKFKLTQYETCKFTELFKSKSRRAFLWSDSSVRKETSSRKHKINRIPVWRMPPTSTMRSPEIPEQQNKSVPSVNTHPAPSVYWAGCLRGVRNICNKKQRLHSSHCGLSLCMCVSFV